MADSMAGVRRPVLISLLLLLISGAVFHDVLGAGFVRWDDGLHVYANPYLHPVSLHNLTHFWRTPYQNLYIPLSYSLYSLLALAAQLPNPVATPDGLRIDLDPRVFHRACLGLHLITVLLVFLLLRRLLPHKGTAAGDWAAGAGALLFAVHPVQVESVAWIAEMRGLLAGLLSLLALHAYLRHAEAGHERKWYALATLCFGLALLAKPSAVALPLTAALIDALLLRRPWRAWVGGISLWGGLALIFLLLTRTAQPVTEDIVTPLWFRPLIASDALAFYAGKLFWPTRLGIDYGRSPAWLMAHPGAWLTVIGPLIGGITAWRLRRRAPWLTASIGIFAAALLPTLGWTPFVFQVYSTVADRYLYLALLGPALALAWILTLAGQTPWPRVRLAAWSACGIMLLLCALASGVQTLCWRSSIPLFMQALRVNPQSWGACNNLASVALDRGQPRDALPLLTQAVHLRPGYAEAHANRGIALLELGDRQGAEGEFREATRLKSDFANAYTGLGDTLLMQGRSQEAAAAFRQALALQPGSAQVREALKVAERAR